METENAALRDWKRMARLRATGLWAAMVLLVSCAGADAAEGKIYKVLPHFLDLEGRHALSPSLYERDAYQWVLRNDPSKRSGLRFDILWKARADLGEKASVKLKVELRGSGTDPRESLVLEQTVRPRRWRRSWSEITLSGAEYARLGELQAWRVSLWEGDRLLAERKSFLW